MEWLCNKQVCVQLVEVVCCRMTQMQRDLYNHFLESKATARLIKAAGGWRGEQRGDEGSWSDYSTQEALQPSEAHL